MNKYFYLSWEEGDKTGIAYALTDGLGYELAAEVKNQNKLPFEFQLQEGEFQDYLANSLAWPMMSELLKNIIDENITENIEPSWIIAIVNYNKDKTPYYIPYFKTNPDVLDNEKTIFAGDSDFVVKAHLSFNKVHNLSIFPLPDIPFTSRIIIAQELKEKIKEQKLTGMVFEEVPVS